MSNVELKNFSVAKLYIDNIFLSDQTSVKIAHATGIVINMSILGFAGATKGSAMNSISATCNVPADKFPFELKDIDKVVTRTFVVFVAGQAFGMSGYFQNYDISYSAGGICTLSFSAVAQPVDPS